MGRFLNAYIDCALWSTTDESTECGGEPMDDNYDWEDIAFETLSTMLDDCLDFVGSCGFLMSELDDGQCGHDFWLTRNGHGAGFWDRGLGTIGDLLSDASRPCGQFDLYVGDDGLIYGT